jgi:hypothetical protein
MEHQTTILWVTLSIPTLYQISVYLLNKSVSIIALLFLEAANGLLFTWLVVLNWQGITFHLLPSNIPTHPTSLLHVPLSHIPSSPIHPKSLVFTPFSFPTRSKYRPGPPHIGTNTSLLLLSPFPSLPCIMLILSKELMLLLPWKWRQKVFLKCWSP